MDDYWEIEHRNEELQRDADRRRAANRLDVMLYEEFGIMDVIETSKRED